MPQSIALLVIATSYEQKQFLTWGPLGVVYSQTNPTVPGRKHWRKMSSMSPAQSPLWSFCEWIRFWQLWDESEKHSFLLAGLHRAETDHPHRLQYTGIKVTGIHYDFIFLIIKIYLPVPGHSLSLRDLGR